MAKIHGKDTVVKLDDSGGTLRDLSQFITSVDIPVAIDVAEVTGMGQPRKNYITGLQDSNPIAINGNWDDTPTTGPHAVFTSLIGGTAGYTLEVYPAGTASGKPKFSGEALLTSYSLSTGVGGQITFTVNLAPFGTAGFSWGSA